MDQEQEDFQNFIECIRIIAAYFGFMELELNLRDNRCYLYVTSTTSYYEDNDWISKINKSIENIVNKAKENKDARLVGVSINVEKFLLHDNPNYIRKGSIVFTKDNFWVTLYLLPAKEFFKPDNKIKAPLIFPKIIEQSKKKKKFWELWK